MTSHIPYRLTFCAVEEELFRIWGIADRERYEYIENILQIYDDRLQKGMHMPQSDDDLMPGKLVLVRHNNQFHRGCITRAESVTAKTYKIRLLDIGSAVTVSVTDIRTVYGISHLRGVDAAPCAEDYILCDVVMKPVSWNIEDLTWVNRLIRLHSDVKIVASVAGKSLIFCPIVDKHNSRVSLGTVLANRGFADLVQIDQVKAIVMSKYGPKTSGPFAVPPPRMLPNNFIQNPYQPYPPQFEPVIPPVLSSPPIGPPPGLPPSYLRGPSPKLISQPELRPRQYRVNTLPIGSKHEVYVSHVLDGMQSFTIQLKKNVNARLTKLMARINDIQPEPIDQLLTGTMCLGRFSEDGTLCRAVVSMVLTDGVNLMFVDFGNSEIVPFDEIYKIPPEFLEDEIMALPFTVAKLASNNTFSTSEAAQIFTELVTNNEHLSMAVTQPEKPLKQYCELYLNDRGTMINIKTKILDKVKLMKPTEYQKIPFKKNSSNGVIVSYVESAIKFFVQLEVNQNVLDKLMTSVEEYCVTSEMKDLLFVEDVNENMAVCSRYSGDDKWYRGLITEEPDPEGNVTVFYVDYGNQDIVHFSSLRIMNNEMISNLPMQAIECQLDIDSISALKEDAIAAFVDMVDGNAYTMKVLNCLPQNVLLVELIDEEGRNIRDLLMKMLDREEVSSPVTQFSKSNVSHGAGNWRERNNSSNDGDFSAFRRDDNQQRPRGKVDPDDRGKRNFDFSRQDSRGIDETDDASRFSSKPNSSDRWPHDKADYCDRPAERSSRDDWSNKNNARDDCNRRFDRDGEGRWNRERDGGDRKPYRRQDDGDSWGGGSRDGDSGERRPYRRREDDDSRGSRDGDGGFRKPFNRDDRRGGGGGSGYRKNDDWNTGEKNDNDWSGSKSKDSSWGGKKNSDWNDNKNDSNRNVKKNDSDWNNKKNDSDWSSKRNDSDRNSKKNDSDWGGKPKFDRDDRRPRRDGDYKLRGGGGPRQRHDGFGQNDGFKPIPSLIDGYPSGSQIAENEFQVGQQMEVVISWFLNPVHFFLIPADNADFRQLMETMQSDYPKRKNAELNNVSPGDFLVARDKDNVIYRAKVIQKRPGGATVTFVDYGNNESASRDQVWTISSDHCSLPAQAVCCGLYNISSSGEGGQWSLPADVDRYFGKEKYTVTFVECREEASFKTWFVDLIDENDANIADLLVSDGLAVKNTVLKSEEPYDIELLRDQILTVFSEQIESSKKFFVHIEPTKANLIDEKIATLVETSDLLTPLPTDEFRVGQFCLAPANANVFCRAQILSVNDVDKLAHIVYIDYGDENDVAFDTIKTLPEYLMIYNPQIVECRLHDAESFTNEEAFSEALNEKDFIIKVVDVIDNKLSVLVYDINGSRLPYPVEVEESVHVLCSLPMLKSCEKVYITHITSDKVYLSRTSDVDFIAQLCDQLNQMYDVDELTTIPLETDTFYAAKSKVFESWYRCILPSAESQEVYYIDYGNTEKVEDLLAVKPLDKKFFASPTFCVAASSSIKFSTTELTPLIDLVTNLEFNATFKKQSDGWYVDLKCDKTDKSLAEFATESGCAFELTQIDTDVTQKPYIAFDNWQLNEEKCVFVSHVISPNVFYLQLASDIEKIATMQRNLQLTAQKLLPVVEPVEGWCTVQKSDGEWCRAFVSSKQNAFAVDFGETLTLSVIKKLPFSYTLDQSNYIVECSLNVQPVDASWSDEAIKRFVDIVKCEKKVEAKLEFLKTPKIVDLIVNGVSVTSTLVEENLAQWKRHEVIVSYANSLSEFYLQDSDQENELFELADKLKEADSWESVDPAVDDVVVAQFVEDQMWYRAVIVKIEDDTKFVRFIDYGNESECDQFRLIPDSLKSIPKFAVKCTLHEIPENADELNDKFVKLVSCADREFTAYFLSRDEPMLVLLYHNDMVIEDVLQEKPSEVVAESSSAEVPVESVVYDNVVVCHINSPSSFFVQSETVSLDSVDLIDMENAAIVNESAIGDIIAALFPDDGVWYRAKITEIVDGSINVLFIDYGNSCVVEQLRQLPEEVRSIPPLAKHCAFSLLAGLEQWPDIAKQRFAELTCEGNTVFKLNVLEEGDPACVDLQDAGVNVADELATLCKADLTTTPLSSAVTESIVSLSHVQSLNEIWIQFQLPQLDEMANEMANAETFDSTDAAEEGSLVAALFEDDGIWYRAKLTKVTDERFDVLFIDYGNSSTTSSIKSLPADLVNLPALSKCCQLKDFIQIGEEHVNAVVDKLKEMVDAGQTFIMRELVESGDVNYVSLVYENNQDLTTELIGFCNSLLSVPTSADSAQFEDAAEKEVVAHEETHPVQNMNKTESDKPLDVIQNEGVISEREIGVNTESALEQPVDIFQQNDVVVVDEKTDEIGYIAVNVDSHIEEPIPIGAVTVECAAVEQFDDFAQHQDMAVADEKTGEIGQVAVNIDSQIKEPIPSGAFTVESATPEQFDDFAQHSHVAVVGEKTDKIEQVVEKIDSQTEELILSIADTVESAQPVNSIQEEAVTGVDEKMNETEKVADNVDSPIKELIPSQNAAEVSKKIEQTDVDRTTSIDILSIKTDSCGEIVDADHSNLTVAVVELRTDVQALCVNIEEVSDPVCAEQSSDVIAEIIDTPTSQGKNRSVIDDQSVKGDDDLLNSTQSESELTPDFKTPLLRAAIEANDSFIEALTPNVEGDSEAEHFESAVGSIDDESLFDECESMDSSPKVRDDMCLSSAVVEPVGFETRASIMCLPPLAEAEEFEDSEVSDSASASVVENVNVTKCKSVRLSFDLPFCDNAQFADAEEPNDEQLANLFSGLAISEPSLGKNKATECEIMSSGKNLVISPMVGQKTKPKKIEQSTDENIVLETILGITPEQFVGMISSNCEKVDSKTTLYSKTGVAESIKFLDESCTETNRAELSDHDVQVESIFEIANIKSSEPDVKLEVASNIDDAKLLVLDAKSESTIQIYDVELLETDVKSESTFEIDGIKSPEPEVTSESTSKADVLPLEPIIKTESIAIDDVKSSIWDTNSELITRSQYSSAEKVDEVKSSECNVEPESIIASHHFSAFKTDIVEMSKPVVESKVDNVLSVEKVEIAETSYDDKPQLADENNTVKCDFKGATEFVPTEAFSIANEDLFNDGAEMSDSQNKSSTVPCDDSESGVATIIVSQWFERVCASVNEEFRSVSESMFADVSFEESKLLRSSSSSSDDQPGDVADSPKPTSSDTVTPDSSVLLAQSFTFLSVAKRESTSSDDKLCFENPVSSVPTLPGASSNEPFVKQSEDDDGQSLPSSSDAEVARTLANASHFEDDYEAELPSPINWNRVRPPPPHVVVSGQSRIEESLDTSGLPSRQTPAVDPDDSSSVYFDSCAESRSAQLSEDDMPLKSMTSSASDEASIASDGETDEVEERYIVSYVNTPGNFFVQRIADAQALRNMEEQLDALKGEMVTPEVVRLDDGGAAGENGSLYGTEIDGHSYRVRVLDKDHAGDSDVVLDKDHASDSDVAGGYTVCCIDYGRVCKARKLFNLTDSLAKADALAMACCVQLPYYLRTWPVDVCHEFERLVQSKQPKFQLRLRGRRGDGTAVVDLIRGSRSIAQRLKTLCEEFNPGDTFDDCYDK